MLWLSHERLVTIGGGNSDLRATSEFFVRSEVQSGDDRYNCFWSWHKYGLFFLSVVCELFRGWLVYIINFFGLTTKMTQVEIPSAAKKYSSFGISVSSRSRVSTDWYVAHSTHSSPMDDPASVFVSWNLSLIKKGLKELTNFNLNKHPQFLSVSQCPLWDDLKILEHESADCCFPGSLVQKAHWKFVLCRERLINKPSFSEKHWRHYIIGLIFQTQLEVSSLFKSGLLLCRKQFPISTFSRTYGYNMPIRSRNSISNSALLQ